MATLIFPRYAQSGEKCVGICISSYFTLVDLFRVGLLLKEKVMSGKLLIEWSQHIIKDIAVRRYLSSQEALRNTHAELANLFFSEFCEENSESDEEPAPLPSDIKETPFQSTLHRDVTYSMRHVEESWVHLLKAGDILKLKSFTICNYDFLLAAVSTN